MEDAQRKKLVRTTFYGCLDRILECQLDDNNPIWSAFEHTFFLLAVITPCATEGQDAAQCHTTYSDTTAWIVTDLWTVQCVVGRVKSRGSWGIIDRSGDGVKTEFISTEDLDENEDKDEDEV